MITKESLIRDLTNAGIDPKGTLLCHFSMKQIGLVEGGADTVLDSLMEYMKNGLLVIPCHTWANIDEKHRLFDPQETPSCIGLLPNLFRMRKGVVRTNHPTHSVCAYGANAEEFCAGQEQFDTPCAPDSCYGVLAKRNAQVMMIGVDFKCNTSVHCIEELADVPNRLAKTKQMLYRKDQTGKWIEQPQYRHQNANSDYYVKLEPVMFYRGLLKSIKFGCADTLLFREQDLFDTTLEMLKRNIDLFGNDDPIPAEWF